MNTKKVLFAAFIAALAALPAFAVPSSMVYSGRIVKPGNEEGRVFVRPTLKKFRLEVKNAGDQTVWAAENVPVMVQTNGMFTIELGDGLVGVQSGGKSLKEICAAGEASQIVAQITGTTYMSREELVTVPLVEHAAVAESLMQGGEAFVLGNVDAREIIVRGSAEVNNLVVSNSLKCAVYQSINIGEIDYPKLNELSLSVVGRGNYAESRVFNNSYFMAQSCKRVEKSRYELYYYDDTLLISHSDASAKVYTNGKKSGMLLITGNSKFPAVTIPFSGDDIKWPFDTLGQTEVLVMYFFPFGTAR